MTFCSIFFNSSINKTVEHSSEELTDKLHIWMHENNGTSKRYRDTVRVREWESELYLKMLIIRSHFRVFYFLLVVWFFSFPYLPEYMCRIIIFILSCLFKQIHDRLVQRATSSHIDLWPVYIYVIRRSAGAKIHAGLMFVMFNIGNFLFIDVLEFFGKYHKFYFGLFPSLPTTENECLS